MAEVKTDTEKPEPSSTATLLDEEDIGSDDTDDDAGEDENDDSGGPYCVLNFMCVEVCLSQRALF